MHLTPARAAERWVAFLLMAVSLIALAALPGAQGLGAAALLWLVAFALFEHAKRPTR